MSSGRNIDGVIASLGAALRAFDHYTAEHSDETEELALQVAERLAVPDSEVLLITQVAALHDIGKIGVPTSVLRKRGPLDPEEFDLMRQHPVIGERILGKIPELTRVARAVRHEHERWDGTGYPDGLAGEEIPLASRIVLACDAWHAMTSDRPYRRAMPRSCAIAELRRCAGTQFDPRVIDALLSVLADDLALAA